MGTTATPFPPWDSLWSPLREHVLFVTGDVVGQRIQEFLERHHLPHVAKPFRVEELCLAVHKMLCGNRKAAAL